MEGEISEEANVLLCMKHTDELLTECACKLRPFRLKSTWVVGFAVPLLDLQQPEPRTMLPCLRRNA